MLKYASDGFEQIAAGGIAAEVQGETRIYRFEGFSVRLPRSTVE